MKEKRDKTERKNETENAENPIMAVYDWFESVAVLARGVSPGTNLTNQQQVNQRKFRTKMEPRWPLGKWGPWVVKVNV